MQRGRREQGGPSKGALEQEVHTRLWERDRRYRESANGPWRASKVRSRGLDLEIILETWSPEVATEHGPRGEPQRKE